MYLQHFELGQMPFSITPDTSFFMNRAGYQDALNVLLVALRSGEGFVKVTGEVGVGKTMLCRKLLNSIGRESVTAYIHNPYLEPRALLLAIADELGLGFDERTGQHTVLKGITQTLLAHERNGRRVVLCLDEVQAMPVPTLETLRLLTNLETEKRKLLQVVLFGQPELDQLLEQPSVRQLKQRITFSYQLAPMNPIGLKRYIKHRLLVAGTSDLTLFSSGAFAALHAASGGIPRLVNILCHKAMLVAFGKGVRRIERAHVKEAVEDTLQAQCVARRPMPGWWQALLWTLGGSVATAAVALSVSAHQLLGTLP